MCKIYKHREHMMQKHCGRKLTKGWRKGSRKVQKSVPTTSLMAWHSWTVAHAYGFFWTALFGFHGQAFLRKQGTCCNAASPATQYRSVTSTIVFIISITVHQCQSNRFRGRCSRTDFRKKFAKGARNERERHTWPQEGNWPFGLS